MNNDFIRKIDNKMGGLGLTCHSVYKENVEKDKKRKLKEILKNVKTLIDKYLQKHKQTNTHLQKT